MDESCGSESKRKKINADFAEGEYLRIQREWENGDCIEADFPMEISYRTWQVNKNSVSVDYGPLTLSLKIGEKYVKRIVRKRLFGIPSGKKERMWKMAFIRNLSGNSVELCLANQFRGYVEGTQKIGTEG